MSTAPTAALFDIGNVLVAIDFETPLGRLIPPGETDPLARMESLLEKKNELEAGAMGDDEFVAWASARLGFDGPPEAFRKEWNSIFEPIPAMWGAVSFLRTMGLKLILFSNTNAMHAEWLLENDERYHEFDGKIFSHQVGALKPDPEIYHHAMEHHGVTPADTLYIDDLPENIATGRQLGFRCHQYDKANHHAFVTWLDEQFGVDEAVEGQKV